MSVSIFGRILDSGQVEDAVKATLQKWLHTYLNEAEKQRDLTPGLIIRPLDWVCTVDPEQLPNANLPTVAIENSGLLDEPEIDGDQTVTAAWGVSVTVYAKGKDRDDARTNARVLAAAIRAVMLGKPSLDGFAEATWWVDEDDGIVEASRERTLAGAEMVFGVLVANVARLGAGPDLPDPLPGPDPDYGEFPVADRVEINLNEEQ